MNELFGIPMDSLVVVLTVLVALALGAVGALAVRNRVSSSSVSAMSRGVVGEPL